MEREMSMTRKIGAAERRSWTSRVPMLNPERAPTRPIAAVIRSRPLRKPRSLVVEEEGREGQKESLGFAER
jgi:hypothetical protein